jgi:hypothetical protein
MGIIARNFYENIRKYLSKYPKSLPGRQEIPYQGIPTEMPKVYFKFIKYLCM